MEPIELVWRARNCSDLQVYVSTRKSSISLIQPTRRLHQVQQYHPGRNTALREKSDRSPIPAETEIILIEVDIQPFTPPKTLWSKHDNVSAFTLDLIDGDLEVYEVDQPLPGFLPFTKVTTSTRVVQTEQEVVGRKMRGKVEGLGYKLNGVSPTE